MDKEKIRQLIIKKLSEDLRIVLQAARAAHAASVHEENKAENEYDTLSLEASYIAQGQANRASEIRLALASYKNLALKKFGEDSGIGLSALVLIAAENAPAMRVFMGPEAGGLKVEHEGAEIIVITSKAPLGQALIGKCVGDQVQMGTGRTQRELEILEVC